MYLYSTNYILSKNNNFGAPKKMVPWAAAPPQVSSSPTFLTYSHIIFYIMQ